MIKTVFKELQREGKTAKVIHFKDDNSITIKFESENVSLNLYIENVKELENHLTVAIVKINGKYRPLYLCDIELKRKSCLHEMYIYEAKVIVNDCFSYDEIYTTDELEEALNRYTIFLV